MHYMPRQTGVPVEGAPALGKDTLRCFYRYWVACKRFGNRASSAHIITLTLIRRCSSCSYSGSYSFPILSELPGAGNEGSKEENLPWLLTLRFAQLSKILLLCDLRIFSNVRSERGGVVRNCHRHSIKRQHGKKVNEKKRC